MTRNARRRVYASMDTNNEPLVLSVPTVARLLCISKGSCYEAVRQGQIPSLRFGRRIVIPRAALDRLLAGDALINNGAMRHQ